MSFEIAFHFRGKGEFAFPNRARREHNTMQFVIAAVIGLVSGVASGLFGVGGGIVMVPAMVYFLTMDIKLAIGTSLVVIIPTAASGVFKHYQLGNIDWRVALSLAPTAVCGGYLGAWLDRKSTRLNSSHLVISYAVFCLKKKIPAR